MKKNIFKIEKSKSQVQWFITKPLSLHPMPQMTTLDTKETDAAAPTNFPRPSEGYNCFPAPRSVEKTRPYRTPDASSTLAVFVVGSLIFN